MTKVAIKKTAQEAVDALRKKYGNESVFVMSGDTVSKVDVIPSGSIGLNYALGVGGYPRGRITEIMGNESSGKTTLTLHAISEAQKLGELCLFIDAEHALDVMYAKGIGVDLDSLLICQPDNAEQALDILVEAAGSGDFGIVVLDSVAALVPIKELDGESGDVHMGLMARMMSQAMRRVSGVARKTNTALVFVNQYRMNIGAASGYGPSKTTPGGKALGYYASCRLDVARVQTLGAGNDSTANRTKVTVKKNKVAPPYRTTEFDIVFGAGISIEGELIDACVANKTVVKGGSWYKRPDGTVLSQGKESFKNLLIDDRGLFDELMRGIDPALLAGTGDRDESD